VTVVRVVVLNYEGGDDLVRAVDALAATRTEATVQIVVVDNGSTDTSVAAVEAAHPDVEVRRTGVNRGFGANNDALGDLDGIDYVALVNNDAFVEPGWLDPLVDALASDDRLGAVQAKILFEPRFVEVHVETLASVRRWDPRRFGIQLRGARVEGADVWGDVHLATGGLGPTLEGDDRVEWTAPWGVVRVPVDPAAVEAPAHVELLVGTEEPKWVRLAGTDGAVELELTREPRWVEVPLGGVAFDVINSVGGQLLADGSAADRGVHQRDDGQFDRPSDLAAWSGGAVLLRPAYLADVGLFDERFFLYYEDTDLSARGRARGWRYGFVPTSVVRHRHAASSGVASPLLRWHVERNRLLYLTKDAPLGLAGRAVLRHPLSTLSYARRDVVAPLVDRRPVDTATVRLRLSAYAGYLRLAPTMLAERWQARR
jgi:GT2 family glycosyltransferase